MNLLQLKKVSKFFGATPVFTEADLRVNSNERVGIVGPNGAGKTTLLKVILGQLEADQGEITKAKQIRIGYLAQTSGLDSSRTIWDEMLSVFSHIREMETQLRHLENMMGDEKVLADDHKYQKVLDQYAHIQEAFEKEGGYQYETRIRGALHGLGLANLSWEEAIIHSLSGGQKTRVALAKMLLEEPDLLILDEPTNYLDMEALRWLEQTLAHYPGALLLVSHDRYFLDQLVEIIYEVDRHQVTRYTGNYTRYLQEKEERLLQWQQSYDKQQTEKNKLEEFVQRNIARASTTKRAQSRRKTLEKMEMITAPPKERKQAAIRFPTAQTSGQEVLTITDVSIGYGSNVLADNLHFHIKRGERIALLGPNGAGKTTLLKTIAGRLPILAGEIQFGAGVQMDVYDQEQTGLTPENTVLDELWNEHPNLDQTTVRSYLGQFLFHGDDVFKLISSLSGGEKARLSLLKRMINRANLLLMDEPTNHLDMPSKERLEDALQTYTGTLLFVSHDRYFINKLATHIIRLTPTGLLHFEGNYNQFLQFEAEQQAAQQAKKKESSPVRKSKEHEKKETVSVAQSLAALEDTIAQLEEEKEKIEEELCQPEIFQQPDKSQPLQEQLTHLTNQIEKQTQKWSELAEEI
ncbi:ABC-F family ATP-binding cassette domain-containing protein [Mechercharimyces sp. CAU 1602]|uniref:ABC-F family ATP-binding cassette domain-containing protein n=1 Tax=Mechercharimyces sp. CAU 1602 TaxID=2973933 RepID=UPI002161EE05|nr:ABC-F family ATP-binding cassette domain-containing protein [Mechercharimyces sp. CAU 1602]MCS1352119.1 ABC-F family ATP-binding cassette domain-containing protein [Mechercharimyces sp. CAU 1602]